MVLKDSWFETTIEINVQREEAKGIHSGQWPKFMPQAASSSLCHVLFSTVVPISMSKMAAGHKAIFHLQIHLQLCTLDNPTLCLLLLLLLLARHKWTGV